MTQQIKMGLLFLAFWLPGCVPEPVQNRSLAPANGREVFFCFWNVENFFDNVADKHSFEADKEYDHWFSKNPADFRLKVDRLTEIIMKMNGGKGPDILALAEVEEASRSPEILMAALNSRLENADPYTSIAFKNPHGGRAIATCVISKIPIKQNQVTLLGKRLRILEVPILLDGKELLVVASHWTSKVSDKDGASRKKYADQIHGNYIAMARNNPDIDYLVCGDFNANPEEEPLEKNLKSQASAKRTLNIASGVQKNSTPSAWLEFPLYNPFVRFRKEDKGTLYYRNKPDVFDQILVSPGLLDSKGWSLVENSAAIYNSNPPADAKGHPKRFGNEKTKAGARGYSDHFPVTAKFKVNP